MTGLGSLSANAWNLNENMFNRRTGGYWFQSCANWPLLEKKFWTAENILALFCKGSVLAPLVKIVAKYFNIFVSVIKWSNSDLEKST